MEHPSLKGQARLLVEAEESRGSTGRTRLTVFSVVFGIINLLFCSYYERFLTAPLSSRALLLFVTFEGTLLWAAVCASYFGGQHTILRNTHVFPLSRTVRFRFLVYSTVRKPVVVALWITTAFAVGVIFGETLLMRIAAALLYGLLGLNILLLTSAGFLVARRHHVPPGGTIILEAGLGILVLFAMAIIGVEPFLHALPPFSWASQGILGATRAVHDGIVMNGLMLAGLAIAITMIGRRYD